MLRLCGVQEKLAQGILKGELTLGFIGGSLTKGEMIKREDSFPSILSSLLASSHPHIKIRKVQHGYSGISSAGGRVRLPLLLKEKPDIVFLDYALNETESEFFCNTYECMVRCCLEEGCAVVLLLFCNQDGRNSGGHQKKIGEFYHLPVLEVGQSMCQEIKEDIHLEWLDYAFDRIHLNEKGHKKSAMYLYDFLENCWGTVPIAKYEIPKEYLFLGCFHQIKIEKLWINSGSQFKAGDVLFQGKLRYSMAFMEYIQSAIPNEARVFIIEDGEMVAQISPYSVMGWENDESMYICGNGRIMNHDLKILVGREATREGWDFSQMGLSLCLGIQKPGSFTD